MEHQEYLILEDFVDTSIYFF